MLCRRDFLQMGVAGTLALLLPKPLFAQNNSILLLYFSRSGNTRTIATMIASKLHCTVQELKPLKPYPENYDTVVELAKKEQKANARPQIAPPLPDIKPYDTIFVGYPNWWGTMPMLFFTLFESLDWTGKTIIPFCTHGGSGMGQSERDIKKLCPKASVQKGLAIYGTKVGQADKDVSAWLSQFGLTKAQGAL